MFGKKRFSVDNTQQRASTPQQPCMIPHKRIFKEKTSEEIFSARCRGEQLRLKESLLSVHRNRAADSDDSFSDDIPDFQFLKSSGWKPSGAKAAPIPKPPPVSPRKPAADEGEVKPLSADAVTKRLLDDIERRSQKHEKELEKALKKTEATHKPQITRKPGEEEPPPADPNKVTKRLLDDVQRRSQMHEKAVEKALKRGTGEPKKLEDLDHFIDKLYNQPRQRQQAKQEAIQRKLFTPKAPKKLTPEEQRANSARMYTAGREREKQAIERAAKKYIDDVKKPAAKLSEEQLKETGLRLSQRRHTTSVG